MPEKNRGQAAMAAKLPGQAPMVAWSRLQFTVEKDDHERKTMVVAHVGRNHGRRATMVALQLIAKCGSAPTMALEIVVFLREAQSSGEFQGGCGTNWNISRAAWEEHHGGVQGRVRAEFLKKVTTAFIATWSSWPKLMLPWKVLVIRPEREECEATAK